MFPFGSKRKFPFRFENHHLSPHVVDFDVHGAKGSIQAFIDTGSSGDVSGKVPESYFQYAQYYLATSVTVGHGEEVPCAYIDDGIVTSIDGKKVSLEVPILFFNGPQVLGATCSERVQ